MTTLGLDCGSSSVKAAVLRDGKPVGRVVHGFYKTSFDGIRAELPRLKELGVRDLSIDENAFNAAIKAGLKVSIVA